MKYLKLFENYDPTGVDMTDNRQKIIGEEVTDKEISLQIWRFLADLTARVAGWYVASDKEVPQELSNFIEMKQSGKTPWERYVEPSMGRNGRSMETEEDMKKYFIDGQSHFGIDGKPNRLDNALQTVINKIDGKTQMFPDFIYKLPYKRFMDISDNFIKQKWGEVFGREEMWKVITNLPMYKSMNVKDSDNTKLSGNESN
jgi:hypothetical protein